MTCKQNCNQGRTCTCTDITEKSNYEEELEVALHVAYDALLDFDTTDQWDDSHEAAVCHVLGVKNLHKMDNYYRIGLHVAKKFKGNEKQVTINREDIKYWLRDDEQF